MKQLKERKHRWTLVPNPKCRLCKVGKLHTEAQHKAAVKKWNEDNTILSSWDMRITSIK